MPIDNLVDYLKTVKDRLNSWKPDALRAISSDYPDRTDLDVRAKTAWYRGHSGLHWKLWPSVCRLVGYTTRREVDMNLAFRHKASFLPDLPPANDLAAWLSRMQHHGLPTRLLDWTESQTAALYFAIDEHTEYARWERMDLFRPHVWMLNPFALNWVATAHSGSTVPSTDPFELQGSTPENTSRAWGCWNIYPAFAAQMPGAQEYDGPMAVVPHALDLRMHAQRARFTVHGMDKRPIEEMFNGRGPEDLQAGGLLSKIEIDPSPKVAASLLAALSDIGVSRSTLFPDFEGVCIDSKASF